jgi:hypothetical protein
MESRFILHEVLTAGRCKSKDHSIERGSVAQEKRVMINLNATARLREEFRIAARLEGMDMSTMLRNFMIRTIREAKEREPGAFPPNKSPTGGLSKAAGKGR